MSLTITFLSTKSILICPSRIACVAQGEKYDIQGLKIFLKYRLSFWQAKSGIQILYHVQSVKQNFNLWPKWSNKDQIYLPARNNRKSDKNICVTTVFKTIDIEQGRRVIHDQWEKMQMEPLDFPRLLASKGF